MQFEIQNVKADDVKKSMIEAICKELAAYKDACFIKEIVTSTGSFELNGYLKSRIYIQIIITENFQDTDIYDCIDKLEELYPSISLTFDFDDCDRGKNVLVLFTYK